MVWVGPVAKSDIRHHTGPQQGSLPCACVCEYLAAPTRSASEDIHEGYRSYVPCILIDQYHLDLSSGANLSPRFDIGPACTGLYPQRALRVVHSGRSLQVCRCIRSVEHAYRDFRPYLPGGALSFIFFGIYAKHSSRSAGLLLCSLGLGVLLLLGIALTERCEGWVDLHVLQRFDLRAETVLLQNERVGIESREDLFAFIETELPQRLEVREVRVVSRSSVPKELLALESATNAPLELNSQNMPMQVGALSDVDLLVPIPSTGDMIGVSTGRDRQSLNSGEIAFLQDLGHCRSVRVHELEVEGAHRKHALRETVLRQQLTEAELRALRAQVNPHFLFNSLNTIADLIVRNPVNAERMTLRLSSVFRHVLAQADRQFVTLTEEFSFLRNYLGIEQERFGENLQVSFEMDPEATDAVLPTLLLEFGNSAWPTSAVCFGPPLGR
jgi:hypothetical protein